MSDPILSTAASGLSGLSQYGIAGIMLMLLLAGGLFILRFFMAEFKACHDATKETLDKNTDAFRGVEMALVKLQSQLDK